MTIIKYFHFTGRFLFLHSSNTVRMQHCCFFSSLACACGNPHFFSQSTQELLWGEQKSVFRFLHRYFWQFWDVLLLGHSTMFPFFEFLHAVLNWMLCRLFPDPKLRHILSPHAFMNSVFQYVRAVNTCCSTVYGLILLVNMNQNPVRHDHLCGRGVTSLTHLAGPGSIPGRISFPGWVFPGFFLNCKTNVRKT